MTNSNNSGDIASYAPFLIKHHPQWKKNRAFTTSKGAVMAGGSAWMPRAYSMMSDADFASMIRVTSFYPACIRVLSAFMGLIFRDKPDLITKNPGLEAIEDAINPEGDNLTEFAASVVREVLVTNLVGVLVDYPSATDETISAATAFDNGIRPFLTMFTAENIMDYRVDVVRNHKVLVYVKLKEGENTYLELSLDADGFYVMTRTVIHQDGEHQVSTFHPTRNGERLFFIPFQIISTNHKRYHLEPSTFNHMVDLNQEIWFLSSLHLTGLRHCATPFVVVTGLEPEKDDQGKYVKPNFSFAPGSIWDFPGRDTKVDIHEFTGQGVKIIADEITEKKSQLARTGARVLQDDKTSAAEAAETITIRMTADNASLAAIANTISRQLEKSLRTICWWLGDKDTSGTRFNLNTDYSDKSLTKDEIDSAMALMSAGLLSEQQMFNILKRPGGFIDAVVSYDEYTAQRADTLADRPSSLAEAVLQKGA